MTRAIMAAAIISLGMTFSLFSFQATMLDARRRTNMPAGILGHFLIRVKQGTATDTIGKSRKRGARKTRSSIFPNCQTVTSVRQPAFLLFVFDWWAPTR